jgi:hypothetical protein
MRISFIIKNVTATFYNGNERSIKGIMNMPLVERFLYLLEYSKNGTGSVTMKIGNGSEQDWNTFQERLKLPDLTILGYKFEQRPGHKLAQFSLI